MRISRMTRVAILSWPVAALTLYLNHEPTAVRAAGPTRFTGPTSSQTIALSADDALLGVVNPDSNSVSFCDVRPGTNQRIAEVRVGTEPYGLALTPTAQKLYVANARSYSVTVIDTTDYRVLKTITNVGFEPRGIAITNSGGTGADTLETVYVTQFLALPTAADKY